jgi:RNA polymerase sigma factor (sigma-70 family)
VSRFIHETLKQLADQQVRFAPPARKHEQVGRAEKLLAEIDPAKAYPYQYVCFRITDYRSDANPDLVLPGADLKHDLGLLIRQIERSIPPIPIGQALEPMLSLDEISRQFHVSTKTITRWRVHGLIGSRVIRPDGRRQLAFPRSVIESFVSRNANRVEKGAKFCHLTDTEKDAIVRRARRLAAAGGTLTEVSRRVARRLDRSAEAVRYTIKNYDRANPASALFPSHVVPLDGAAKEQIYTSFMKGTNMNDLAKRYGRTRSSLYRVINEVRAERLIGQPVDYIYNADFDDTGKAAEMLAPMPGQEKFDEARRTAKPPKDVPAHLSHLYETPLLTAEQERHMFRKMNFLKHKLHALQQKINPAAARVQDLQQVEELRQQVQEAKALLIQCNMRLVVNNSKQHVARGENLDDLISDGNLSLMRAVEKFDYGRGFKFSTYATWAIRKNFARSIPDEHHHKQRYLTGHDEVFEARADVRTDEQEVVAAAEQARDRVNRLLDYLDPRTRDVIRMRTGLDGSEEMTLEQIGQHFGITKERVRQINVRGMKQLREKAQQENVDLP